jgi:ABC-2 type transport system ATP-binding protein
MMNYETPAVVVDGLRVFRGTREVLPGISLSVPRGQVVGLLGPSGGGKTTLLRSIVGVQIVAGGTVTVLGEPAGSPGLRSRVGYVTQDPSVYSDLTVRENITYFATLVGAPRDAVERAIESVDLTSDAGSRVDRLCGATSGRSSTASRATAPRCWFRATSWMRQPGATGYCSCAKVAFSLTTPRTACSPAPGLRTPREHSSP